MTNLHTIEAEEPEWVPEDACTLPTAEQPLRVAEFDEFFAATLRTVERSGPARVRLLLEGDDGLLDTARALAERETSCCSFFTFEVTEHPGLANHVVFQIVVPPSRADVLEALVVRARAVAGLVDA